jgi:hypothetical protein
MDTVIHLWRPPFEYTEAMVAYCGHTEAMVAYERMVTMYPGTRYPDESNCQICIGFYNLSLLKNR